MFSKLILRSKNVYSIYNPVNKTLQLTRDHSSCGPTISTPVNAQYKHYLKLPLPPNKIFATYVWIDGSGIHMRSKDRVIGKPLCELSSVPKWSFDGSSTGQATTNNSDTLLIPCALYRDPFRRGKHVIVLCETCYGDGTPTSTNHRANCAKLINDINSLDPWFGIEQEYTIFDSDMWPLGWPKCGGLPTLKSKFSYCGVGPYVAGRHIVDSHARACVYAGMDYGGSNAEVMKGSWEFQVGTTLGIKAADDLWLGRYLLNRIAEDFGAVISYHPKPMGKHQPGVGCHHNFSTNKMRSDGGLTEIERVCKVLCERHAEHMKQYGLGDGEENKKRLSGKFETASFNECRWAVADRGASVRLQRGVMSEGKGFLEDRRPAGDCDPYRVCALLSATCTGQKSSSDSKNETRKQTKANPCEKKK